MTLLEQALEYAAKGWRVHPLHDVYQGRCSCMGRTKGCKPGKHPRLKSWQNRATTDPATIKAWWTKWPHANIGICTGHTSGIVVIDIDDTEQVPALVELLGLDECFFLDTMTIETGSGGYHFYFTTDLRLTKNNTGAILPGVDFIAEGGYVVAPPSISQKGEYKTLGDADPAPLPEALLPLLQAKGPAPSSPKKVPISHTTGLGFPKKQEPFSWGMVNYGRLPRIVNDMIHRFPIIQNGEHSNRDDQTIRMVGYLLVVGHSPATAREVGKNWLALQQDQFKTSLTEAVTLLEEKIRRTHRDIQQGNLTQHTEEQWLDRMRKQGFSYRLASLASKKCASSHTTGLGGQGRQLSPQEAAYVLAVLRLVLFKLLETDESSIFATNRQLMDLAGLSDPKQTRRMRDKFISEGKRLAGVMELLVLEKKGGKKKGKGFPSSYALGEDLGALLASEPEYEDRYDPATEAFAGHETYHEPVPAQDPALESGTQPEAREGPPDASCAEEGERCPTEPRSRPADREFPSTAESTQKRRTRNEWQSERALPPK